jgi:flagellar protein FliL
MAEGEAKTEEKPAPKESGGGGGMGKLFLPLLLVNTVLLAAVLAVLFLKLPAKHGGGGGGTGGEKAAEGEHASADPHGKPDAKGAHPGPMLRLPDFVVHLRDPDSERYARMSFELEVQDEKAKEAVTARMPQIRDTFLAYLSDRTAEELRGSDAIARVKSTLAQKLSEIAPGAPVRSLYVTDLIVQ